MTSIALDVGQVKTIAIGLIIALAVAAVLVGMLVRAVIGKVLTVGVLLALAVVVWTQRASLNDCATKRDCTFFGYHVSI